MFRFLFILIVFNAYSAPQKVSKYITIDQFGYLPDSKKIAVIRDPQTGYDAAESFSPGNTYQLKKWDNDQVVFESKIVAWNNGLEDPSSGDKVWWFDFSKITQEGDYYIFDTQNELGSHKFTIGKDVYNEVLKHAVRTFYYQRSGTAKLATHAGEGWADAASFVGKLQDKNCRLYNDRDNISKERDLSGGWFDAGDYNKYTTFLWDVIPEMLSAYEQNPKVWSDNYNIPESGNGVPDILDEIKWGTDWLLKMQETDGSVLSLVGVGVTGVVTGGFSNASSSPPSLTTGQSLYGPATTDATYVACAIFAHGAKVFKSLKNPSMTAYGDKLQSAAIKAWNWANANPNVKWRNNDAAYNSKGLAAGGTDKSSNVGTFRTGSACYLYALTNESKYKTEFENNYSNINMMKWSFVYKYESPTQDMLLYYTKLPNISSSVRNNILSKYNNSIKGSPDNLPAVLADKDPYLGYMADYVWGSNSFLCRQGTMYFNMLAYDLDTANHIIYRNAASNIINKMHGVNPFGIVYLTNMSKYGAENSCTQIWHSWFKNGSSKWDQVGSSQYGPPPGFVPGGPMSYKKDACCGNLSCGGSNNNVCNSEEWLPIDQPKQKGYKDINTNWPLNTWAITENAIYYQAAYIKLLSKFTSSNFLDIITKTEEVVETQTPFLYPNPSSNLVSVKFESPVPISKLEIVDILGKVILETKDTTFSILSLSSGLYYVKIYCPDKNYSLKLLKN